MANPFDGDDLFAPINFDEDLFRVTPSKSPPPASGGARDPLQSLSATGDPVSRCRARAQVGAAG